jgi:hypothetical protein
VLISDNSGSKLRVGISKPGIAQVFRADIPLTKRGQGLGTAIYERAIQYAADEGRQLVSDTILTPDAERVWQSLARRGHDIVQNPTIERAPNGDISTRDGKPVFELRTSAPRAEPTPTLAPEVVKPATVPTTLADRDAERNRLFTALRDAGTDRDRFNTALAYLKNSKLTTRDVGQIANDYADTVTSHKSKASAHDEIEKAFVRNAQFENKITPEALPSEQARTPIEAPRTGWTPDMEAQYKEWRRGGAAGPPDNRTLWAPQFEERLKTEIGGPKTSKAGIEVAKNQMADLVADTIRKNGQEPDMERVKNAIEEHLTPALNKLAAEDAAPTPKRGRKAKVAGPAADPKAVEEHLDRLKSIGTDPGRRAIAMMKMRKVGPAEVNEIARQLGVKATGNKNKVLTAISERLNKQPLTRDGMPRNADEATNRIADAIMARIEAGEFNGHLEPGEAGPAAAELLRRGMQAQAAGKPPGMLQRIGDAVRKLIADEAGGARLPGKKEDLTKLSDADLITRSKDPTKTKAQAKAITAELQRRVQASMQPKAGQGVKQGAKTPSQTAQKTAQQAGKPPPTQTRVGPVPAGQTAAQAHAGVPPGVQPHQTAVPPPAPPAVPSAHPAPGAAPYVSRATASDLKEGLFASIGRLFYPRGESGFAGKLIQRRAMGQWNRIKDIAAARFANDLHQVANKMTMQDFRNFMQKYESGNIGVLPPDQQRLARALKSGYDDVLARIQSLPATAQMLVVQDFAAHMYEQNAAFKQYFSGLGKSAAAGSLRKRTHLTYEDAFNAGLNPLSSNPIEHFARYIDGIGSFIQQKQIVDELERGGWSYRWAGRSIGASGQPDPMVVPVKVGMRPIGPPPPPGYEPLVMPWTRKSLYPGGPEASMYVPRDMAYTLNQAYTAGLRGGPYEDITNFLQRAKNIQTGWELGLSLYHATTEMNESLASGLGRGVRDLMAGPQGWARLPKTLLDAFKDPFDPIAGKYSYGSHLMRVWADKTGTIGTPQERAMFEHFQNANIHPQNLLHAGEYEMTHLSTVYDGIMKGTFVKEWQNLIAATSQDPLVSRYMTRFIHGVSQLMQTASQPLFRYVIPRLKLVSMMKDMQQYMYYNPHASYEDLDRVAARISDSNDNRFGEAVRDNLGMQRTIQDIGYLTMRSLPWTVLGPGREIVGGYLSAAKGAARPIAGGKDFQWRVSPKDPNFDPRIGYAIAYPMSIGFVGALASKMMTGLWPWQHETANTPDWWQDYLLPRTGETTRSGDPERMRIPGYHKDFLGYAYSPIEEATAKLAGIWTMLGEQMTNETWWNQRPITPPDASLAEQLYYRGQHVAKHFAPISFQQFGAQKDTGVPEPLKYLGFGVSGQKYTPTGQQREQTTREKAWESRVRAEKLDPTRFAQGGLVTGYGAAHAS